MNKIFGYCRISTKSQDIERQVRNILTKYPEVEIIKEIYTGTEISRPEFQKLLKKLQPGDTIVFDSVSRMSRNAAEGVELYIELFEKGITLVFLKEPHINTDTYKSAISTHIELTGDDVDLILEGVNAYLKKLARKQVEITFEQAQKEVDDLRQRTKEGIETAKRNGKQIGQPAGTKLTTKKEKAAIPAIYRYSKSFCGSLKDSEVMKLLGLSKNTYYKYKQIIKEKINKGETIK